MQPRGVIVGKSSCQKCCQYLYFGEWIRVSQATGKTKSSLGSVRCSEWTQGILEREKSTLEMNEARLDEDLWKEIQKKWNSQMTEDTCTYWKLNSHSSWFSVGNILDVLSKLISQLRNDGWHECGLAFFPGPSTWSEFALSNNPAVQESRRQLARCS